jgi:YidC/Oxa1 family membrane protein insertase
VLTTLFVQPILNLLIWLYDIIPGHDIGLAIILLTLVIKVILFPLTKRQIEQQRALQDLQPKMDEIRARLKDDKEAQAKALMELYQKEKVNPAASCLPLLIQLPVFIGLYQALRIGLTSSNLTLLYPWIPNPGQINTHFLGLLDLTHPSWPLAVLAALVQFWQTKQILKPPAGAVKQPPNEVAGTPAAQDESTAAMVNKQMAYTMPIVTLIIGFQIPGGLSLYWLAMGVLTVWQQAYLLKKLPPRLSPQLTAGDGQTPSSEA